MKCQHCFKLVFLGVASICVVGLVGCGTPHFVHRHHEPQLLPRPADSAAQVACRVVLDRFEPFIVAKVVHSVPKSPALGFDLFGSIVDAGFDAARENIFVAGNDDGQIKAVRLGAPLLGHLLGASFSNELQSGLSAALISSPCLHLMHLELARAVGQVQLSEVVERPVVQISLSFHLWFDVSSLILQAHFLYFHKDQRESANDHPYTFFSEPAGSEHDEAAVAKWMAGGQQLLRQRKSEEIIEVIALMQRGLLNPEPADATVPVASARISCLNALNLSHVQWAGHVLRSTTQRILFQDDSGNYFSRVPENDPVGNALNSAG